MFANGSAFPPRTKPSHKASSSLERSGRLLSTLVRLGVGCKRLFHLHKILAKLSIMFIIYADMLNTKATLGTNRLTSFRIMRPHTSELTHREIIFKTAFPLKD